MAKGARRRRQCGWRWRHGRRCALGHAEYITDVSFADVFVEAKRVADFIASHLCQAGFPTTSIHGDRLQREREEALADFKYGKTPTLIATSVASRGPDIKDVASVVNYDLPKAIDDYVHRIGALELSTSCGRVLSSSSAGAIAASSAEAQQET
ncbi:probable ATP-dependent RNA helicase DDX4 [Pollicipes pollicipes]|uniref:probable ATP-dependent RNA helicase DDX4 n=1 Tax=Pollicipes pollicipes TaxID=41117 RepID=UPI00188491AF|nr:probable ATP-dependent RNA helicase DDX4 [Pollicipes pollicipes]